LRIDSKKLMAFARDTLEIFSGTMLPQRSARRKNCLSACKARVFSRQRSEDVHGRKKIRVPAKAISFIERGERG